MISDIITKAESFPEFIQQKDFQLHIDYIKLADQRVEQYRAAYDSIVAQFNAFLDEHKKFLKDIDQNAPEEKKPLFQVADN